VRRAADAARRGAGRRPRFDGDRPGAACHSGARVVAAACIIGAWAAVDERGASAARMMRRSDGPLTSRRTFVSVFGVF